MTESSTSVPAKNTMAINVSLFRLQSSQYFHTCIHKSITLILLISPYHSD